LIPILFALQEGGSHYSWQSSEIIGTLVGGIVALITFVVYESWLQLQKNSAREPIFPIRFIRDPMQGLLLLYVCQIRQIVPVAFTYHAIALGTYYLPASPFTPRSSSSHNGSRPSTTSAHPELVCCSSPSH
jgi:hypothetical protein